MSYQEEQFSKIANSIRVMQGGTTDTFSATDFANQIRNIDRDSLPYKSTIALEDNYVVVEDSLDDELDDMVVYGASEQTVTEQGWNYCPDFSEWTLSGGAYFDDEGWLVIDVEDSGETTASATITVNLPDAVNDGGWHVSLEGEQLSETSVLGQVYWNQKYYTADGTTNGSNGNTAPFNGSRNYGNNGINDSSGTTGVTSYMVLAIAYNSTYSSSKFRIKNPCIYDSAEHQATDYTPFVPNSPSPDYPSEIRSVGGEVAVQGKNLFDITQAVSPLFVANGDGTYTYTADGGYGFANSVEVYIPANTLYTLSIDCGEKLTTSPRLPIVRKKSDGTNNYSSILISGNTRNSMVYAHDYDVVSLRFYTEGWTAGDSVEINNIQLELGSEATAYTPYVEPTTMTIPTLCGIGDVKDILYVDRAQERAWVERKCYHDVYTGGNDEQWRAYAYEPVFSAYIGASGILTTGRKSGLCNMFLGQQTPANAASDGITYGASDHNIYITTDKVQDLNSWLSFLQEHNMTVVCKLATPTIEELDYTALPTHFGGTTIMITPSDDSPSPVVAEVTLRTTTDHENEDIVSMALISMGVTPSGDTETDLASLAELGVNPYSVTSYDTSENYADAVQAMGVQPTNNATDNIEILNELGVSVYE